MIHSTVRYLRSTPPLSCHPSTEKVILLRPDRFTSQQKTPWAGTAISTTYKKDLIPSLGTVAIGESWEFSCDPTFPSLLLATDESLIDFIRDHAEAVLSPQLAAHSTTCEILVKLLHAASPLSVQVHPEDGDPNLRPGECGKPESWLVLDAEPGAGLYLGFSQPLSKAALHTQLRSGADLTSLLQFIPVTRGDYFEIAPGVCHAIGPGVMILEPQRLQPGKTGKTYRLWDWNRTYDSQGHYSATGTPRELHIEESLAIIDPPKQYGPSFVQSLRRIAHKAPVGTAGNCWRYPPNPYYQTCLLELLPAESCDIQIEGGYGVGLVLEGTLETQGTQLKKGQSFLLPFHASPLLVRATESVLCAWVLPAQAQIQFLARKAPL